MIRIQCGCPEAGKQLEALFGRPAYPPEIEADVAAIIADVRARGDAALVEYAKKFDRFDLTPENIRVSDAELAAAEKRVSAGNKRAIRTACAQVRDFARLTVPRNWKRTVRPGVMLGEKFTPLDRVAVYIPGGTAPLVSTVIHTAGIASACGVREIVAVTPPGGLQPETLYAMKVAGVTEIYRLGGVYGVAAAAVGTATVRKAEKLVGPGNAYVTAAKKLLYGEVAIDLVAGPSEILVVADEEANPVFVAADLLSQAEHGSGLEQAVLVSPSAELIEKDAAEVELQSRNLPRIGPVEKVMANGMFLIRTRDLDEAVEIANAYAPEHLELQTAAPEKLLPKLTAAGAIFLGPWTPEPIGDFCAGPSHVLPTASSAKRFSGLESAGFFRRASLVRYSERALRRELEIVERFGAMEQLAAHGNAGSVRASE